MTCKDIEEKLTAYQEGTLSPEERSLVESHLSSCAQCSSALANLEKTVGLLKNLPEIEPPPWFTQKVMAQVREEAEKKSSLLKRLFYPFHIKIPIEAFATLCVVALGLYVYKASGPEIKTYQTPPATTREAPVKDMPVSKLEGEAKPTASPKIKPDSEALTRNAPVLQPSIRTDEQKTPSEAMMEQKVESPVATGAASPAPLSSMTKEKDISASTDTERKGERAKRIIQFASRPQKADSDILAGTTVILSVENTASAHTDIEKILGQSGITITKKDFKNGVQTLIVNCPEQKFQWLLDRLGTIGKIKHSPEIPEATDGDLQITIRVMPR
jgi:anti-sigma factor RsiW